MNRNNWRLILLLWLGLINSVPEIRAQEDHFDKRVEKDVVTVDPLELIEEHAGDSYFWPLFGIRVKSLTLPLPVIVRNRQKQEWSVFMSSKLADGRKYEEYYIATKGEYAGKIVTRTVDGSEIRPLDLSFTKNAAALFVSGGILFLLMFSLALFYKRHPLQMPRRLFGALEMLIEMLVKEVIRPCLGRYAREYTPYLLSLFFFILTINLLGLTVIFPGGVNLSGNVSVCLVLASCTLVLTLLASTRGYWREIFLPDVPIWLNTPIPLMTVVEVFGIFTKPMALMVRMFANLFGGHVITIVLTSLIFIFAPIGVAVAGGVSVFVVLFSIFMLLIEVLVCFIQAYVFFMLSSLFIGLSKVEHS